MLRADTEVLISGLRAGLGEAAMGANDAEVESVLRDVLSEMSLVEGLNFKKALRQVGHQARRALSDPTVRQIAAAGLPVAAGAAGTALGGPVGTAIGTHLGAQAAGALAPAPAPRRAAAPRPRATTSPAAKVRSSAAGQALQLSMDPQNMAALLKLALGSPGGTTVDARRAQALSLLGTFLQQAAREASPQPARSVGQAEGYEDLLAEQEHRLLADAAGGRLPDEPTDSIDLLHAL